MDLRRRFAMRWREEKSRRGDSKPEPKASHTGPHKSIFKQTDIQQILILNSKTTERIGDPDNQLSIESVPALVKTIIKVREFACC
jgi:hypothetical protein